MNIQKKRKAGKRKGFTLVELIVTVAILGIITAIAVPTYYGVTESSNKKIFETNRNIIVSGINMYISAHNGAIPPTIEALLNGKYLPSDAWDEDDVTENEVELFKDEPKDAIYKIKINATGLELYTEYKSYIKTVSWSK